MAAIALLLHHLIYSTTEEYIQTTEEYIQTE